jgi:hypothetical protein
MARVRTVACTLALVGITLAGCLGTPQPLGPTAATTVGGAAALPEIVAEGAEVIKHADAVELVWKGTLGYYPRVGAPGVFTTNTPLPQPLVRNNFTLPSTVTFAQVNLTWTSADDDMAIGLRNEAGRTQCRAFKTEATPAAAGCQVYLVGARGEDWPMHVDVVGLVVSDPGGAPYELHLNLSIKPFTLLGPALTPDQRAPALTFAGARVDEDRRTGEPSLKVDDQGVVYVAAPTDRMQALWKSTDGVTFEYVDIEGTSDALGQAWSQGGSGGGDAEVYVTPDGKDVYFADLWGFCMSVGASHDGGATWEVNPLSCDVPVGQDRQWLWAQPGGHLWMVMNGASAQGLVSGLADPNAGALYVMHSIDGGRTWIGRTAIPEDNCARGNVVVTEDGKVFVAGCNSEGPGVAAPEGMGYAWHNVAKRSGEPLAGFCYVCGIFTVVDADKDGNLYVAWADPSEDDQGFDIWLSTSQDDAATWSTPVRVNHADGNAVQPWIAAREPGHVAIAWYQTKAKGSPDEVAGEWYVHMAESWDALAAAPAFAENLVSAQPVQFGPICLSGSACVSARNLLDFLMVDIDAQGKAHLAYIDGSTGGSAGNSFVMYARQLGGPAATMSPGAPGTQPAPRAKG